MHCPEEGWVSQAGARCVQRSGVRKQVGALGSTRVKGPVSGLWVCEWKGIRSPSIWIWVRGLVLSLSPRGPLEAVWGGG